LKSSIFTYLASNNYRENRTGIKKVKHEERRAPAWSSQKNKKKAETGARGIKLIKVGLLTEIDGNGKSDISGTSISGDKANKRPDER